MKGREWGDNCIYIDEDGNGNCRFWFGCITDGWNGMLVSTTLFSTISKESNEVVLLNRST